MAPISTTDIADTIGYLLMGSSEQASQEIEVKECIDPLIISINPNSLDNTVVGFWRIFIVQ